MDSTAAITLVGESETVVHQHALEVIQFGEIHGQECGTMDFYVLFKYQPLIRADSSITMIQLIQPAKS
ncbi:hypothetical protein LINPERPRIM_LOCUS27682 [Linum perenne]